MRVEGYNPGLSSYFEILARHYLAPIPTSLLTRVLDPVNGSIYGDLDDLYRLVYQTTFYVSIGYILLNLRSLADAIRVNFGLFHFLAAFSVGNAVIYSLFSAGGGHARTKFFSTLIVFYTVAAILKVKNRKVTETDQVAKIQT